MTAGQIIATVGLSIIGILLFYLFFPRFMFFCEDFGENISELFRYYISEIKDGFIEAAKEWKYFLKRWTK